MSEEWKNQILYKTENCISDKIIGEEENAPLPRVHLYWKVSDKCNADCKMCAFHSGCSKKQDIEKLVYICNVLHENGTLNTIHITGGEPGLYVDMIGKTIERIRKSDKNILICTNSNGINLEEYVDMMLNTNMNIINVSRHHYSDSLNNEIFQTNTVAQTKDLQKVLDKVFEDYPEMVHLNCVLIKGYIDNVYEFINYLEYLCSIKVLVSGIVNLMDINEYSKAHFIDFLDFEDELIKNHSVIKTRTTEKCDKGCRCSNYLYQAMRKESFGRLIGFYARHVLKRDSNEGTIVFDGEVLTQGFDGTIIL